MLLETYCSGSSRLPCPQCWWICFSIIPDLILYNWRNVVSIYLLRASASVIVMHMLLDNIQEWHSFPFPEVSHSMPARILTVLPPSTRTCLFLDSKNIGFHSCWSWWNRHVPMLMLHLCHGFSPLLISVTMYF